MNENIIVLSWNYKDNPNQKLAELIYLVNERQRCRTWQYMENGHIVKTMLIDEQKIADTVSYTV